MPKSNKVGDINDGVDLTTHNAQLTPTDAIEKKTFWQKLGVSEIIPTNEERDEFERGRMKYMHNKLVVDANESYFYYWSAAVSIAYVYNLIVSF